MWSRIMCEDIWSCDLLLLFWSTSCGRIKSNPIINNTYFLSVFLFPLQRRKVSESIVQLREREECVCVCVWERERERERERVYVLGWAQDPVRPDTPGMCGSICKAIPWSPCCLGVATKGLLQNSRKAIHVREGKKLRHWLGPGDKPQTFPCRFCQYHVLHSSWLCHGPPW